MSEEEWDRVSRVISYALHALLYTNRIRNADLRLQCWSANVKVPKALLSEARETFEANPDGGHMITTGSVAVCNLCFIEKTEYIDTNSPRQSAKAAPACPTR